MAEKKALIVSFPDPAEGRLRVAWGCVWGPEQALGRGGSLQGSRDGDVAQQGLAALWAWPGHLWEGSFCQHSFITSLLAVMLQQRINSQVFLFCYLKQNFPKLPDPFCWCGQLLHFRLAGCSSGSQRALVWGSSGCAAAPVSPGGAGEGNRNQVRFALRLLGNPCLGSLQRDIQGRSTGNAYGVSRNEKWSSNWPWIPFELVQSSGMPFCNTCPSAVSGTISLPGCWRPGRVDGHEPSEQLLVAGQRWQQERSSPCFIE